jgi:D-3-phosphoglycerate dehydrogenase
MRILHLEAYNFTEEALNELRKLGELDVCEPKSREELDTILDCKDYDCIFTTIGNTLDSQNLKQQKILRYIVSPTTGLNHIDLDYTEQNNISVISLKGESEFLSSIQSTAEHTWFLVLALLRNISKVQASVSKGLWSRSELLCDELNTKSIGIIGYGRLGKIVARYAQAFSMQVRVCETNLENQLQAVRHGCIECSQEELLAESDVVVLLATYAKENEKMIGKEAFSIMKKDSVFVNTSRGELVDEAALLEALKTQQIKAAALDVLVGDSDWKSTIPPENTLYQYALQNNNLLLTPHIGGYGKVSIQKTRDFITQKFLKNIKNETHTYS